MGLNIIMSFYFFLSKYRFKNLEDHDTDESFMSISVFFFLQLDGWSIFELGFLWKLSLLLSAVYMTGYTDTEMETSLT